METLGRLRDVAVLILVVEYLVLGLVPLAAAYLALRGMAWLAPRARMWLDTLSRWTRQFARTVATLMRGLLAPILFFSGLWAGAREAVATLRRR